MKWIKRFGTLLIVYLFITLLFPTLAIIEYYCRFNGWIVLPEPPVSAIEVLDLGYILGSDNNVYQYVIENNGGNWVKSDHIEESDNKYIDIANCKIPLLVNIANYKVKCWDRIRLTVTQVMAINNQGDILYFERDFSQTPEVIGYGLISGMAIGLSVAIVITSIYIVIDLSRMIKSK